MSGDPAVERYLDLLMRSLVGDIARDDDLILGATALPVGASPSRRVAHLAGRVLDRAGLELRHKRAYDPAAREVGSDWPQRAVSMIGLRRMRNLDHCIEQVLRDQVPGDLIETGVWRGGATIFMRGALAVRGVGDRTVWVADSFQGLPPPDTSRYPADAGDGFHQEVALRVGVEQVRENFRRYDLLDDRVRFLVGWFEETLPTAPIEQLAVLRMDGDMYSSTTQALNALYPKLSPGGFCIVDDYGIPGARDAVHDYRAAHGVHDEILDIDGSGAFWRRAS